MKHKIYILIPFILLLSACVDEKITPAPSRIEGTSVVCEPAIKECFSTYIELSGTLSPAKISPIFLPQNVGIKKLYFNDGEEVKKNDLLLSYDTSLLNKKICLLNGQIKSIEDGLSSTKKVSINKHWYSKIFSKGKDELIQSTSDEIKELKKDAIGLKLAELEAARMEALELKKKENVIAPFDGNVVMASNPLMKSSLPENAIGAIIQMDPLEGKFLANQYQLNLIKEDQGVTVKVDGISEQYPSRVESLSPVSIPNTQLFEVKVKINNSSHVLKSGMFAQAVIETSNMNQAITIPIEAINYINNETFVFTVSGDIAKKVPVTLGARNEDRIEVLEGLTEGTLVITDGKEYISSGDSINIQRK